MKKKILSLILAAALMLGVASVLASCSGSPNAEAESFVAIDINPSVELTVDDNGYVLSAYGANEDAQVLLYGEDGIVGAKLEDAVEKITDLAVELGYINEGNNVVSANVYAESDRTKAKLEGKIEASVNKSAGKAGLTLTVNSEELYSIVRELEIYKENHPEAKDLTVAKYRLAVSASESGDLTLDAAVKLDNAALIEKINEAHKQIEEYATKAFLKAREEANRAYDKAIALAQDAVYLEYFADKIISDPASYRNASFYVAYASAANGLETLERAIDWLDEDDYELTEDETAKILEAFGLTSADKALIAGNNGIVTIRTVENYANKVLRNIKNHDEREALEDKIDDILDEAEERIEVIIEEQIGNYKPEIDAILATAEAAIRLAALAPGSNVAIEEFEEIKAEYARLTSDGEFDDDDVEELVEIFMRKSRAYKQELLSGITPEDQTAIDAKREQVKNEMTTQKEAFNKALEQAEADAKAYLAGLKAERVG